MGYKCYKSFIINTIAEIAIMIGVSVATSLITSALTPKTNLPPTDLGRHDDIRIMGSEYGTFVPIVYGRARLAGNICWSDGIQPIVTTTPGSAGGGKKGGTPTPPQNNYAYYTNLAMVLCEGPVRGGLKKMWEGVSVAGNFDIPPAVNNPGDLYQAEASVNTLTNGAIIQGDPAASNEQKVHLPNSNSSIRFNAITVPTTDTYDLYINYSANADLSCKIKINGGAGVDYFFDSTGTFNGYSTIAIPASFVSGSGNTVEIYRDSGFPAPDIDSINVYNPDVPFVPTYPQGVTGAFDELAVGDPDDPQNVWNLTPIMNGGGGGAPTTTVGTLQNGNLTFYNGDETQLQDPFMVSIDGADVTPAYRGLCYVMLTNYKIENGALPNFTFEIDEGTHDLADIITDLYARVGLDSSYLDVTSIRGIYVRGLVINQRGELQQILDTLQVAYNFDLIDADGKIKAVLRTGISTITIPEEDLRAYEAGGQAPISVLESDYADEAQLPREIDITYIDTTLDYHTNVQPVQRQLGGTSDPQTMNLPLVLNSTETNGIGLRLSSTIFLERAQHQFSLGPKYLYALPTDVVTLNLTDATHVLRLLQFQSALPGLIKIVGTPDKASVYNAVNPFVSDGTEHPPVDFPANTKLVLMDVPPVSMADTVLGYYAAACARGVGRYYGAVLYKEEFPDVFVRVGDFPTQCTMGVATTGTLSTSPSYDVDGFDITSDIHVSLYFGTLESFSTVDLLTSNINLAYIGGEWVQFQNAVSETPSDPYVTKYHITKLRRGRFGTASRVSMHGAAEDFVLFNDAVQFIPESSRDHYIGYDFKGVSVGQLVENADTVTFNSGNGIAPPVASNLVLTKVGKFSIDGVWQSSLKGSFDFGVYVGGQRAKVFLKRPEDSVLGNTGIVVYPDTNNQGAFEIPLTSGLGAYQVEVITESPYGLSASGGHPTYTYTFATPPDTILKYFDTIAPKNPVQGLGLTVGVASNVFPTDEWLGTDIYRDRGYGPEKIARLTNQATLGHTTDNSIDWLSDGTGYDILWVVKESGYDFTNATPTEIESGKNNYFVGKEKLGVQTWSLLTPAVAASGTFLFGGNPANNDIITVNGVVFTFKTSPVGSYEVQIGGSATTTATNLKNKLTASVDSSITIATYAVFTSPTIRVVVTYGTVGTVGNSFTLAEASSVITISGGNLTGGVDAGNVWKGENLIRGLSSTEYLQGTHTGQEDFITLDENAIFIPMEARDIDMSITLIAVTFGAALGAAALYTFVFRGRSIIPPPPTDFEGSFDAIDGDLGVEWKAGSSGNSQRFEIEITDGVIPFNAIIDPQAMATIGDPVSWSIATDADSRITLLTEGGADAIYDASHGADARLDSIGTASPDGGLLFEAEIPVDPLVMAFEVVLYPEDQSYTDTDYAFRWFCIQARDPITSVLGGSFYMWPEDFGVGYPSDDLKRLARAGDRIYINLRPDGVGEYGFNYSSLARPLYVSDRIVKQGVNYKVSVIFGSFDFGNYHDSAIRKPRWLRPNPSFRLSAGVQRRIYGLSDSDPLPSSIDMRVRELQPLPYGANSEWNAVTFTR